MSDNNEGSTGLITEPGSESDEGIVADIEMIPVQKTDEAYDGMQKSDVRYRFAIDNASLEA